MAFGSYSGPSFFIPSSSPSGFQFWGPFDVHVPMQGAKKSIAGTGFRISLLAIAPGVPFLWGGCRPPTHTRVAVGGLRPSTPLRKVGLRPPGAARSPQPGSQGPKTSFGIMDLELFGPNGKIGKIGKSKRGLNGPQMGPFGLKLCPNEAECLPRPFGSPPGPFWAHFWSKNQKKS